MEDGELGIVSDNQAGEILFGDHDELHDIVRGVDWEFDGSWVHVRRSSIGECDIGRDVAGDDYDSIGFIYGDDDSDVVSTVEQFSVYQLLVVSYAGVASM